MNLPPSSDPKMRAYEAFVAKPGAPLDVFSSFMAGWVAGLSFGIDTYLTEKPRDPSVPTVEELREIMQQGSLRRLPLPTWLWKRKSR